MSEIPLSIERCITELNFISSIKKGHKPLYNNKTTIEKSSWFVTLKRRWNGEKGENGIFHVNNVMSSCDLMYHMCCENFSNYQDMIEIETLPQSA